MKKQLILTKQQQQLVEDNHKLIYFYLYRNSLSVDEFYDVAAIGLCKAAITYNGQTIDYSKTIYCLKAEQGFYTSNPGVFRQEYDTSYNLKDKTSMPNLPVAEEDYNSINRI